jgi:hypothetical protein
MVDGYLWMKRKCQKMKSMVRLLALYTIYNVLVSKDILLGYGQLVVNYGSVMNGWLREP